jgi:hypothetical protein
MSAEFDVYFAGECLADAEPSAVVAGIAKTFKLTDDAAGKLMTGGPHRIKSQCDKATALKYREVMAAIGAKVTIVRHGEQPETGTKPATHEAAQSAKGEPAAFGVAPSKVPHDPGTSAETDSDETIAWSEPEHSEPDLDAQFTLAPVGSVLAEDAIHNPPLQITVPDYDVSAAGEMIPNLPDEREKVEPRTDHLHVEPIDGQ